MGGARGARTWALVVCALAAACGTSSPLSKAPTTLEVYSWLTAGSERDALDALFSVVESEHPKLAITNAAQDRSEVAQQELVQRMAAGNPPDSFQVVSGSDLVSWIKKGALEPLDTIEGAAKWADVIPAPVLASVSKGGSLYGVPLDIERDNTLFYNKQIFAQQKLALPLDIDQILAVARALQAKGITALSVSASAGWTIASLLFEAVLIAQAGPDYYEAYLGGTKTADTPEVRAALTTVASLMAYAEIDRTSTSWTDAVASLCSGKAAMIIMPDFVKGELAHDGCGPDTIGYVAMQPAGRPTFVFVSITFELPNGAPHRDAALDFLQTVGSKSGQDAFNAVKGSIPARIDADPSRLDEMGAQTLADFKASGERLVPGYAALTSPSFQAALNPALKNFVDPASDAFEDVDAVILVLSQKYGMINER
jgi:glucose/mannose transport system substrate-binding protein